MTSGERRPWIFVIGGAQRGGAEGQLVELAARLRAAGEPVECVFLFGGGPLLEELDRAAVPRYVLLRSSHSSRALRAVWLAVAVSRLAVVLRRRNPSVVMAWLTFATWPTLLLAQLLTSSVRIAGIRGEVPPSEVRWAGRLFRLALRNAHSVVVNSNTLRAEAVQWGARGDRIRTIPNGVEPSRQLSDPRSTTAVLVANYRPYKGHEDLLRALSLCRSAAHVRLCGAGEGQHRVEDLATALGVRDRVHFVEHPADIGKELARAGFAIHPSHTEGLSNAILEEMAAGLPIVAMRVGGNPVLVDDGVNGYLLQVGDHPTLAQAIDTLTCDTHLRRRLGQCSLEKVDQFSWAVCVSRYQDLIQGLELRMSRGSVGAP